MGEVKNKDIKAVVGEHSSWVRNLKSEVAKVIVGQEDVMDRLLSLIHI